MKILPFNVAVLENDTHISRWVEKKGRLDIARTYLDDFRKYIPVGGIVVDAGAFIGDHTVIYSEYVGPTGLVYAFEPNPEAYECLEHNTEHLVNVSRYGVGLADVMEYREFMVSNNAGASWLGLTEGEDVERLVEVDTLDNHNIENVNFIKIDVEGYETKLIHGAFDTINNSRPTILCEVNEGALLRAKTSRDELLDLIRCLDYSIKITDSRIQWSDPQYDIVCTPIN